MNHLGLTCLDAFPVVQLNGGNGFFSVLESKDKGIAAQMKGEEEEEAHGLMMHTEEA